MSTSNWIESLRQDESEAEATSLVKAELKLRDDRMFREKAPLAWRGLIAQIRKDCADLDGRCEVIEETVNSLRLRGGSAPVRFLALRFNLNGHFILTAQTYSYDGITELPKESEIVNLSLQADDTIGFSINDRTFRIVGELARYLIVYVISGKQT